MAAIAEAVKHMMNAGMSQEAIVAAIADMEAAMNPAVNLRKERNRRYYENRLKASENRLNRLKASDSDTKKDPSSSPLSSPLLSSPVPPSNNPPIIPPSSSPKKPEAHRFALPDWIKQKDWDDFEEMRKKIKKPMTDSARQKIITKLDRMRASGYDPGKILEQSIISSWQDVYEPKGNHNARPSRHTGLGEIDYSEGLDGFVTTSPAKRT